MQSGNWRLGVGGGGIRQLEASLGKSRQVGGDGKSWPSDNWRLGSASLGKWAATGNGRQAFGGCARQV